ncbi:MAG: hypothetical protein EZS28_020243 [Streblomastix strix]|uniref:Uncharacterized protein n=1 Tax=Streblomastix strix TaxID=222440 RepID=A0A5J4VNT1_9EUKA|nr:MAG: hypothetical protein EZS28_020243 [Streblomastix strix]
MNRTLQQNIHQPHPDMQDQQCVGIPNPWTLYQQLHNILPSQCVGRETPLTLTNTEKESALGRFSLRPCQIIKWIR